MTEASPLLFWLIAAVMAAVAVAIVLPRLIQRERAPVGGSRRALNVDVYRGQLADLEHDRAEGTLDAADYLRQRTEIERRMVEDTREEVGTAPGRGPRVSAWLVAAALPVGAFALYQVFGTPDALQPEAQRSAAEDPAAFRASLARHLARSPGDARAWVLLGRAEMEADHFEQAAQAFERGIQASDRVARDPAVLTELADALGMMQQTLAGRPTELIEKALALAPSHPRALEMGGSAAYDRGDYARAAALWRQLQKQHAPGTRPWQELGAAIDRADAMAGTAPAGRAAPAGKSKP